MTDLKGCDGHYIIDHPLNIFHRSEYFSLKLLTYASVASILHTLYN